MTKILYDYVTNLTMKILRIRKTATNINQQY